MQNDLKMYILIRDKAPLGLAANAIGHAALATYLKFKDHPETQEWLQHSFRKVTCSVSDMEFERAKSLGTDYEVLTESDWDGGEIAIGFRPRSEWHGLFRYLRLFGAPKKKKRFWSSWFKRSKRKKRT